MAFHCSSSCSLLFYYFRSKFRDIRKMMNADYAKLLNTFSMSCMRTENIPNTCSKYHGLPSTHSPISVATHPTLQEQWIPSRHVAAPGQLAELPRQLSPIPSALTRNICIHVIKARTVLNLPLLTTYV